MKGVFDFSVVDNGGYRLPSREEYCFAVFDGDYRLGSYNSVLDNTTTRFSDKRIIRVKPEPGPNRNRRNIQVGDPISLFTSNGALGLIGLYNESNEFVEPWVYKIDGGYTYYKDLYDRHSEGNTEGFRIACSTMLKQSIAKSVTERYTEQKKGW
jgi:hypothetical protein